MFSELNDNTYCFYAIIIIFIFFAMCFQFENYIRESSH